MSSEGVWGILRKSEADLGMIISYDFVANFPGWVMAEDYFQSLIAEHGCKQILEVGAGANPTLSPQFVQANHLSYIASDLSVEELQKRDLAVERLVLDLSAESVDPSLTGRFDCVLSRMVSEHVSNGSRYHRNIYKILRPGGISAHCFSTLWTLPFIANRYLPERAGNILQNIFAPRDGHLHGKFKAHYSWSRGPSSLMIKRFQKIGFEVLAYTGYFGHWYYQIRFPWLHRLEMSKTKLLLKHPVPQLCSYATFVLRKPR